MGKFGYINQGNPIFIRDDEAQEMVNCKIDRDYLEFGEFKVNTGIYDATPGRQVTLPNGKKLVIDPTKRTPVEPLSGATFASRGQVRLYDPSGTEPVAIPTPTSACLASLTVYPTSVYAADYAVHLGNDTTEAGKYTYAIDLPTDYDPKRHFFKHVLLDSLKLDDSQFSWRAAEDGTPNAGKVIVTLVADPGDYKSLDVVFHYYALDTYKQVFTQPGKYFYALTYVNTADAALPESPPLYLEVEITKNDINAYSGECYLKFTDITVESAALSLFPDLEIRIYRIPFGAEEYRFSLQKNPGSSLESFFDSTQDAELGAILPTEGNTNVPFDSTNAISIALHKEKLFIAADKFLYYSRTNLFTEFHASFFFHFNAELKALAQFNECLAIFTQTEAYILYGDDESNFALSRIDFEAPTSSAPWKAGFSINSAQAISGNLIALAKSSNKKTDSFLLFNSRFAVEASLPVRDILNTEGWTGAAPGEPTLYHPLNASNKNRIIDNRFYVFELMIGDQAVEAKTITVVYDSLLRGFCTYDSGYDDEDPVTPKMLFKWRSKEFHVNGRVHGVQFNRWFYVRGKGKFTVEILGDGVQVTAHSFNLDAVSTEFFQVKSTRYTTFSVRIIGEEGAQIHDWGVGNGND